MISDATFDESGLYEVIVTHPADSQNLTFQVQVLSKHFLF